MRTLHDFFSARLITTSHHYIESLIINPNLGFPFGFGRALSILGRTCAG